MSEHYHAVPEVMRFAVIDLDANFLVLSHPLNLLTKRGERINIFSVEPERYWNNVRLVIICTSQPCHNCLT
jgi:hypothetical protein